MGRIKNITLGCTLLWIMCCAAFAQSDTKAPPMGTTIELNKSSFLTKVYNFEKNPDKWVYEGDKPCIIDFYADWCGPCKQIAPILKEMAEKYKNDIVVYKVNGEKETELMTTFGFTAYPTLLFVPLKGTPLLIQGAMPKEGFIKQIDFYLLQKNKAAQK